MDSLFYVYLLKCGDGTLYCGYTTDLTARMKKHSEGKGAKYTRMRLPIVMVYAEKFASKSEAMRREIAIKKLSRAEKLRLIGEKL